MSYMNVHVLHILLPQAENHASCDKVGPMYGAYLRVVGGGCDENDLCISRDGCRDILS